MKIAIYTAIFGGKDKLRSPIDHLENDNWDYFLFTDDREIRSDIYQIHLRHPIYNDVAKNARYFKILGDPILNNYDIVLWHDANIQLVHSEIDRLLQYAKNNFISTFTHPHRDCFYSEAMTCIRTNKDFSLRILKQAFIYFLKGMPAKEGMYSTGILIKNFTYLQKDVLAFWWKETLNHSRRDQLSFAYVVYRHKLDVKVIDENIFDNAYSVYHEHNYLNYLEKSKIMTYNYYVFKKFSFYSVKVMRKLYKLFH